MPNVISPPPGTTAPPRVETAFLEISGIRKSYGPLTVIENLSLSVEKGQFVSIVGPSGCGKTTLLRMLAGFIYADNGTIILDGRRIDSVPSHRRDAAMVFQNYALFPHMTVSENVGFGLRMHKVPKPEIARRVAEVLELVRLRDYGKRYPRELSGGQQQRVALARAIVLSPKLLLLDEPLSNLDAKLRKELRQECLDIHRLAGMTTIFVTHDLEEAFAISDRVAVMDHGRIEQYGAPVDIFMKPRTRFVADFVGHANVVEGTVDTDGEGRKLLRMASTTIVIPADTVHQGTLRFAIPLHALTVSPNPTALDNCRPGRLGRLSYLGAILQFQVEADGCTLVGEMPVRARMPNLASGDLVYVSWQGDDMIELPPHDR